MSNLNKIIEEQDLEYKEKLEKFKEIAMWAMKIEDKELENLAIKRAAGLKMMVDYMPTFKKIYSTK